MNKFKFTVITALTSVLSVLLPFMSEAQMKVGNNPTTINPNAVLEVESTNKGLLLPRVPLTGKANASPLSSHVAGMLVYNTASAGDVIPGYYYNDGTKWVHLNDGGQGPWFGTDDNNSAKLNNEDMYVLSNKVGVGNIAPNARLDIRTNPTSTTDPGVGMLGIGTTTAAANVAGAGAVRYSNAAGGNLQYSNGVAWNTLTSTVQKTLVSGFFSPSTYTTGNATLNCTETVDVNGNFTSNVFTAPRAGVYLITANLLTTFTKTWIENEELSIGFGDIFSSFFSFTARTGHGGPVMSAVVSLNAGQTVSFGKFSAGPFTVHAAAFNRFSIIEL